MIGEHAKMAWYGIVVMGGLLKFATRFLICQAWTTVVSLFFVGYQFSWFSWVDVTHEIRYPTKRIFSIALYARNFRTTNFRIHERTLFLQTTKIGIHENKWIHSNCNLIFIYCIINFYFNKSIGKLIDYWLFVSISLYTYIGYFVFRNRSY